MWGRSFYIPCIGGASSLIKNFCSYQPLPMSTNLVNASEQANSLRFTQIATGLSATVVSRSSGRTNILRQPASLRSVEL